MCNAYNEGNYSSIFNVGVQGDGDYSTVNNPKYTAKFLQGLHDNSYGNMVQWVEANDGVCSQPFPYGQPDDQTGANAFAK